MCNLDKYYILYFDILGYCNKIRENEKNFLSDVKNLVERSTEKEWRVTIRIFSDNVLVCKKYDEEDALRFLCHYAARIQELMLREKALLLRGAITKGILFIDDKFVYGTGLVDAVELEEKDAQYPRIIVDKKLNNEEYIIRSKFTILADKDEYRYINFLNYYHPNINSNGERDNNWAKLEKSVSKCLEELDKYNLIEKESWLQEYIEKIRNEYNLP